MTLGIRLLAFALLFAAISGNADAAVWYVNDASTTGDSFTTAVGNDANAGNAPGVPYLTLGKALSSLTAGDTLYIDSGVFPDSLVIAVDSVTIIGAGPEATIISPGANHGISASNRSSLHVQSLAVINVTGNVMHGINLLTCIRPRILDCRVFSIEAGSALSMTNCETGYVYNNIFDSVGGTARDVIYVSSGYHHAIDSNVVSRGGHYGIKAGVDSITVSRNRVSSTYQAGIYIDRFNNVGRSYITHNSVYDCRNPSTGVGIQLSDGTEVTVYNNVIDSCASWGFYLDGSNVKYNCLVDSNTIRNGATVGIYINGDSGVFTNNLIEGNDSHAILINFSTSDTFLFSGNRITNSRSSTASALNLNSSGRSITFYNNTVDSMGQGIYLTGATVKDCTFDSNRIKNVLSHGIWAENAGACTYTQNVVETTCASAGLGGIYIKGSDSSYLSGNRVYNARTSSAGIRIKDAKYVTVFNNTIDSNFQGIHVDGFTFGAQGLTVDSNTITRNGSAIFNSNGHSAVVTNNSLTSNGAGIYFSSSNSGRIESNVITNSYSSGGSGIEIDGNANLVRHNRIDSGAGYGVSFSNSSNTRFVQNTVSGNQNWAFIYGNATTSDTVERCNITGGPTNPDSFLTKTSVAVNLFDRCWFGTTDTARIGRGIRLQAGSETHIPFRLSAVDTRPGADTVAPKTPDTVAVDTTGPGSVKISWATVSANEDGFAGSTGLDSYTIYRSPTRDTSLWVAVATVDSAVTSYTDIGLTNLTTYYYRVTASDSGSPYRNESYYSDSIASGFPSPDTSVPNIWYVNDLSTTGDSFTSAAGYDTQHGLLPSAPFRSLSRLVGYLSAGDTVYIDSGTWAESFVVPVDSLTVIGAGPYASVISLAAGTNNISATNRLNFSLSGLGVVGGDEGIKFDNTDRSSISSCRVQSPSNIAISLNNGSETNTIYNNEILLTGVTTGIAMFNGPARNNTIDSNFVTGGGVGIHIQSDSNTVRNNICQGQSLRGMYHNGSMTTATNNLVTRNRVYNSTGVGIELLSASTSMYFDNTVDSCASHGIYMNGASVTGFTIDSNLVKNGRSRGIFVSSGPANLFSRNTIMGNAGYGFFIDTADSNRLVSNIVRANGSDGIRFSDALNCLVIQNTSDSNTGWALYYEGAATTDSAYKNIFSGPSYRPDSCVFEGALATPAYDATRNWWGTTDSAAIRAKVWGSTQSRRDTVIYIPFRLGPADTALNADTVAPRAPDTVAAAVLSATSLRISWKPVTANEDGDGGALGLDSYTVYRSLTSDTTLWVARTTVDAAVLTFDDSGLTTGTTYHYRVTASDNKATFPNESFYSDSIASNAPNIDTSGVNVWYVNDTSTAGDSFTTAVGYDTNHGLSPSAPFRKLNRLEGHLTAGDTIYVDAGFFYESDTYTIDTNGVFLIGKDSASTVIRFDDNFATQARAISATDKTHLTLRDFTVTNGHFGVLFTNVDSSTIQRVRADTNTYGVYLASGSDFNTIQNITIAGSTNSYRQTASNNNTLTSNTVIGGGSNEGFYFSSSSNNILTSNTAMRNGDGFLLSTSNNNILTSNTAFQNSGSGFNIGVSSNNTLSSNTSSGSTDFGIIVNAAHNNMFASNTLTGSLNHAFRVHSSNNNTFASNTLDSNATWGFYISGTSAADTFLKNIHIGSPYRPDSGAFNASTSNFGFDFKRNWWGTTDSAAIRQKIWGTSSADRDSILVSPFRLGLVDTGPGADTVAPKAPATVTATITTGTTARVSWTAVSSSEETESALNLAGYRVYRSRTSDTTQWISIAQIGAATTLFNDSGLLPTETYYYRVTAFDAATFENQSFLSDSIARLSPNVTPVISPAVPAQTRTEDTTTWTIALTAFQQDTDNGGAVFWTVTDSGRVTHTTMTGTSTLQIAPIADTHGTETVTLRLSDNLETVTQLLTITLTPVNDSPIARATVSKSVARPGETVLVSAVTSTDTDNDGLSYVWALISGPNGAFSDTTKDSSSFFLHPSRQETYVIRVTATDTSGATSTATITLMADFGPPSSVVGLQAEALETGAIKLTFTRSPSVDVTHYTVLTDSGAGTAPTTLLTTVSQSTEAYTLFATGLVNKREYRFAVVPVDSKGISGETAHATAVACTAAPNVVVTVITSPISGSVLSKNTPALALTYTLGGTAAQIAAVTQVQYQFRVVGTIAWQSMPAASGFSGNANPTTLSAALNPLGGYTFHWNTSALESGTYEARVVATGAGGETRPSSACSIRFVNPAAESPSYIFTSGSDTVGQSNLLSVSRSETITLVNSPETQAVTIFIPGGSFSGALETAGVYVSAELKTSTNFDTLSAANLLTVGQAIEVKLSNGDTLIANGQSATITLTFRDRDLDGFVDGTLVRWNTLKIYRHSGVAGGSWEEMPTTLVTTPTATVDGVYQTTTVHFSIFRLVGVAASANLSSVIVGPNPYRPNDGDASNGVPYTGAAGTGIYFQNLPASVKIEIYTISGRRVTTFETANSTGQIQWDVRTGDNRDVASGVYIYRIYDRASGQQVTGKLTVIR